MRLPQTSIILFFIYFFFFWGGGIFESIFTFDEKKILSCKGDNPHLLSCSATIFCFFYASSPNMIIFLESPVPVGRNGADQLIIVRTHLNLLSLEAKWSARLSSSLSEVLRGVGEVG